jgi:hypothetical protein
MEEKTEQKVSRAEHIAWCKERALEYCDRNNLKDALVSMCSDLGKHPETKNHAGIKLGMMMMMAGHLDSLQEMRHFIEGFN